MQRQALSVLKDCRCHRKQGSPQRGAIPPEVGTPGKQQLAVELGVGAGPTASGHPDTSSDGGGTGSRDGGRGQAGLAKAEGWG